MGICMMCHKTIPNGRKFCDDCENNRRMKADESYLDSLLNSVSDNSTNPVFNNPYLKKNNKNDSSVANNHQEKEDINHLDSNEDYEALFESVSPDGVSDNPEMDDMLDGLLADMDAAGVGNEPDESEQLQEGDIDDIFGALDSVQEDDGLFEIDDSPEENYSEITDSENADSVSDGMQINIDPVMERVSEDVVPEDIDTRTPEEIELDDMFSNPPSDDEDDVNDKSVVGIDWDTLGEASDISVDPSIADLFADVGEPVINVNNGDDIETLLSGGNDDTELDKIIDDISNGSFELEPPVDEKPKKKGGFLSWFKKLFGNVDLTPEEIEAQKKELEEAEKKKKDKEEAAKLSAESKKEMEALEKAKAKEQAEIKKKAAEAAKAKKEAAAKEKAEKARKKKEAALAIAEYEVDHSRINKAGATILFVIFAVLTIFIIIGTNIYSYNLSIENAQKEFEIQHYNEAYYEVYGLKIQDEDIELYDRIMTVMYVNTQLNSYEHYMKINERERALNSLIKGLQRYEKYYQLATILEISDDLNFVKSEILNNLDKEFNMTEDEAYKLVQVDNNVDYSTYIYGLLGTYDDQLKSIEDIDSIEDLKAFNASLIQNSMED